MGCVSLSVPASGSPLAKNGRAFCSARPFVQRLASASFEESGFHRTFRPNPMPIERIVDNLFSILPRSVEAPEGVPQPRAAIGLIDLLRRRLIASCHSADGTSNVSTRTFAICNCHFALVFRPSGNSRIRRSSTSAYVNA